jgi:hypothetical protein
MRIIILLAITLFSISCENQVYNTSNKQKIANEVRSRVAMQLYKEKELYPSGSGAQMMNEIKMLALSFNYYKNINIEEAREMLISATDKFVNEVNSENEIIKYLYNEKFNQNNVEIRIFLKNRDGSTVSQGNLRVISILEGILEYDIGDPETGLLKTIHRETYDEALKKIGSNLHRLTTPPDSSVVKI